MVRPDGAASRRAAPGRVAVLRPAAAQAAAPPAAAAAHALLRGSAPLGDAGCCRSGAPPAQSICTTRTSSTDAVASWCSG
eukprot:6601725-Prymnesium_polylepis.1